MTLARMQQRRDTSANWASFNPVLLDGEVGVDTTLDRIKVGDGSTPWSGLPFSDRYEEAQAAATSAAASAASAEQARDQAEQITGLTGEDQAVAFLVGDQDSNTFSALVGAIEVSTSPRAAARARAGIIRTVGWAGDSLTNNNGPQGDGFKLYIPALTRGRVTNGVELSAGGYTVREWLDNLSDDFLALSASRLPGRMSVMLGTNDVGRSGFDLTTSRADLIELYDLLESRAVLPIACTILPRPDVADRVVAFNVMVKQVAAARGYTLVDFYAAMVNDSGQVDEQYRLPGDLIHLSPVGYKRASMVVAPVYRDSAPRPAMPTCGNPISTSNLFPNPLMLTGGGNAAGDGSGGVSTYPLGWSALNGHTAGGFVTDTQAEGRWAVFPGSDLHRAEATGIVPGHRYALSLLVRTDFGSSSGTVSANFHPAGSYSSLTAVDSTWGGNDGNPAWTWSQDIPGPLVFAWEATAPATAASLVLNIQPGAGTAISVAEVRVVDLTALNLAS